MGYNKQVNQDDALCVFAGDDTFDDSYGVILKGHQYYEDFKTSFTGNFSVENSKQLFYPTSLPYPFNEIIPDNEHILYAISSKETGAIYKGRLHEQFVTYIFYWYQR